MYGFSTKLTAVNKAVFVPVLCKLIARARELQITCGCDSFSAVTVESLIVCVRDALSTLKADAGLPIVVSDTLVSKILHGTLACMPAFDSHFRAGIKIFNQLPPDGLPFPQPTSSLPTDLERGLTPLYDWAYRQDVQTKLQVIGENFAPFLGKDEEVSPYPTMRVVDQIFWALGCYMADPKAASSHSLEC